MIYSHGNANQMRMDISTGYQMQMRPRKIKLKAKHNAVDSGYEAQGHEQ